MIKIYQYNIPLAYIISTGLVVLFSAQAFFVDQTLVSSLYFDLYTDFFKAINELPLLNFLGAVLIVSITVIVLNRAFHRTHFFTKSTFIPTLVFVLLVSTFYGFKFDMHLIVHFILAFAYLQLVKLEQNRSAIHIAFVAGLIIGLTFLFSFWFMIIGTVVFLSLMVFRPFVLREWIVSVLGLFLPLVYLFAFRLLATDSVEITTMNVETFAASNNILDVLAYAILAVIVLFSGFGILKFGNASTIIERKQIWVLFLFFMVTVCVCLIVLLKYNLQCQLFIVPLTMLISIYISNLKKGNLMSILFVILLILNAIRIFFF